jgi:hypothetical protein
VTTRGVTLAALLAALGRPSWWLLALAGFLVRGGVLLFILAIVSLPSPLVISNLVAPMLVPAVLGRVDAGTLLPVILGVVFLATWLIGGGWIAAVTEIVLVRDARDAMADEGLRIRPPVRAGRLLSIRVAAAHLLAHVPTALVLAIGAVRIVNVLYVELTSPFEVTTPLVIRVVAGAAAPITAIVVVWVICEILGGLAARRIVLEGASLVGGLRGGVGDLIRRPAGTLLPALATTLVLAIDLAALLGAIAVVWSQVRERLAGSLADGAAVTVALLAFGGTWVGALALTGLIDAWRSAGMTFEAERAVVAGAVRTGSDPDPGGTIGASAGRRPGDWSTGNRGGSL